MDLKSNSISHHHYFNDEFDAQKETPFIQRNPFLLPWVGTFILQVEATQVFEKALNRKLSLQCLPRS